MVYNTMPIEYEMSSTEINLIIENNIESEEESSSSEYEKTQHSEADIYYKFRYTFPEEYQGSLEMQKTRTRIIVGLLRKFMLQGEYVAGIEWFKTGMLDVTHHVHIHFVSRTKKDTIVKSLKRSDKNEECPIFNGNRCYALGREVDVHIDKFWRYPLKQQGGDTRKCAMFEGHQKNRVIDWRAQAYAVWITASEIQNKKIEKKEDSDQLSTRLYAHLDKVDTGTDVKIKIEIQKFYIEIEDRPFNRTTALGYFYNWKVLRGRMTHEQLAETW